MSFSGNSSENIRIDETRQNHKMLKFTYPLYNNSSMSNEAVQSVFGKFDNFLSNVFIPFLQQQLDMRLRSSVNDEQSSKIKYILEDSKNIFFKFSTEHRRFQQYQIHSIYIPSETFVIGSAPSYSVDNSQTAKVVNRNSETVRIPLKPTLETIFPKPGVFEQIQNDVSTLEKGSIHLSNIMPGELWKKNILNLTKPFVTV